MFALASAWDEGGGVNVAVFVGVKAGDAGGRTAWAYSLELTVTVAAVGVSVTVIRPAAGVIGVGVGDWIVPDTHKHRRRSTHRATRIHRARFEAIIAGYEWRPHRAAGNERLGKIFAVHRADARAVDDEFHLPQSDRVTAVRDHFDAR